MAPLLQVRNLTIRRDDGTGSAILQDLKLDVTEGEVIILSGPSGCGKTTLLKCLAELNVYQDGTILLYDKPSTSYGIPNYRVRVQYIPQRPSLLPGNPLQYLERIQSFAARKKRAAELRAEGRAEIDPLALAEEWGVERHLWSREWSSLSGGEGQRIALAAALGLGGADVVLLDEPTSALDEHSAKLVERSLLSMLPKAPGLPTKSNGVPRRGTGPKALIWITHSAEQGERVGTRTFHLGGN